MWLLLLRAGSWWYLLAEKEVITMWVVTGNQSAKIAPHPSFVWHVVPGGRAGSTKAASHISSARTLDIDTHRALTTLTMSIIIVNNNSNDNNNNANDSNNDDNINNNDNNNNDNSSNINGSSVSGNGNSNNDDDNNTAIVMKGSPDVMKANTSLVYAVVLLYTVLYVYRLVGTWNGLHMCTAFMFL